MLNSSLNITQYSYSKAFSYQINHEKKSNSMEIRVFLAKVFEALHPGKCMVNNWHIDLMLEYLKALESGEFKRLIVNLPPRSLKSICINVAWPAWLLGHIPSTKIIAISYNQELSEKHSIDCRTVMLSDWYQELFPNTIIARGMNTKSKFCTTQGGFRLATSTGGTLTGEGADVIIIDDPASAADTFSYKKRKKLYEWFKSCLLSRLNDHENGKILLVMQRLHADDLSGMLLRSESQNLWKLLKIPAICIRKQSILFKNFSYERMAGEHLYDNAFTIDSVGRCTLLNRKNSILNYIKTNFDFPLKFLNSIINIYRYYFKYVSYQFKLVHLNGFGYKNYLYTNIFCDEEVLSRYRDLYCKTTSNTVSYPNYDQAFELYMLNHERNDLVCYSQKNYSINSNFSLLKREVGESIFNIQYQQEVHDHNHQLIKVEWLNRYSDISPIELTSVGRENIDTSDFDYVYQSWDCAVKCGDNNDYSVCSSWGVKYDKLYLLNIFRAKIPYPKLRQTIFDMYKSFSPHALLIEDCAAGQQIIQEMRAISAVINIIPIRPKENKITRLTLVSPMFEQGVVLLPCKAEWLNDFLSELLNFPNSEHDDQVDSISQFLLWYQRNESIRKLFDSKKLTYKLNKI